MSTFYHAIQLPLFTFSKICATCGKEKHFEEFPITDKHSGRRRPHCYPCWNIRDKATRKHRRERIREQDKARRIANPEKFRLARLARQAKNPEKIRAYSRKHYIKHREQHNAYSREWVKHHPLEKAEIGARRRARKTQTHINRISYKRILERDGYWCYICEQSIDPNAKGNAGLSFDHVIPLSRGGAHSEENLKPTHKVCNIRKKARLPEEMSSVIRRGVK